MGEEASAAGSSSVDGGGKAKAAGADGVGKAKAVLASKEEAKNAALSGSEEGKQPQENGDTPLEAADGDKPAEADGEGIPRATSAPPLLEEFQKAYGPADEAGQVKPFTDIRLDEDYEEFYKKYSRVKKLPPPVENRHLYAGVTNSPKRAPQPGQGQTPFVGKPSEGHDDQPEESGAPWTGQDGHPDGAQAVGVGAGGKGKGPLPKSQSDSQTREQGEGMASKEEMEARQEKIKQADAALSVGLSRLRVRDSPTAGSGSAPGAPGAEEGKTGSGEDGGTAAGVGEREGEEGIEGEKEAGGADLSSVAALVDGQASTLNGLSTNGSTLLEAPPNGLSVNASNSTVAGAAPSDAHLAEALKSMDPAQAAALALLQGGGIPGTALPGVLPTGLPGMPPVGPGGAAPGLVGWEGLMAAAIGAGLPGAAGIPGAVPGGLLPDLSGIPGAAGPPGGTVQGAGAAGGIPGAFPMAAVAAAAGLPSAAGIAPSNMHLYEQLLRARLGPSMDILTSLGGVGVPPGQGGVPPALGVPPPPGAPVGGVPGLVPGLDALGALGGVPNLGAPGGIGQPQGVDLLSALQAARLLPGAPGVGVGMPGAPPGVGGLLPGQMPGPGLDLVSAAAALAAIQGAPGAPLDMDALLQLQRAQQIAALQAQLQAPLDGAGKPVVGGAPEAPLAPGEQPRPLGRAPDSNQQQQQALLQLLQQQQTQQPLQQQQGQQQQHQQQMMNQASGLPLGLAAAQMRNLMGGTQGQGNLGFGGVGVGGEFEVPGLGGDRLPGPQPVGPTGRGTGHRNRDSGGNFNSGGHGHAHSGGHGHSNACRFFMQSGFCARGDSCPFSHVLPGQGPAPGPPQRGGRGGGGGKGRGAEVGGGGYSGGMPADPWQASRASPPFGGSMPFGGLGPGGVPPGGMLQGGHNAFGGPHMMPAGRGGGVVPGGNAPGGHLGANGVFPFAPGPGQMGGQMEFSPMNPMNNLGPMKPMDAYAALQGQLGGAGVGGVNPSVFGNMGVNVNQHGGLGFNQAPGPGVGNMGAGGVGAMGLGPLGSLPGGLGLGGGLGVGANVPLKYGSLSEVEGRMASVARDQHGCRFLQRQLDEGSREDIDKIYGEIRESLMDLMIDPFGNYLVQKLLEVCSRPQQMEVLAMVTAREGDLVNISLNMHGTRSVQKLIEMLTSEEDVARITRSLESGVVTLIKDLNGNHVVQRCLQRLTCRQNEFIFKAAVARCVEVATHRHGCCVLQRCVDFADEGQRARLVLEIAANTLSLAQDPFGNYVVQYVLDLGLPWAVEEVTARILGHVAVLSTQKFSSNVVEKCLKSAPDASKQAVVLELVTTPNLGQLLQDPFANYVIQSALTVAKGNLYTAFVDAIRPHVQALRSSPYGKRILSKTNLKPR